MLKFHVEHDQALRQKAQRVVDAIIGTSPEETHFWVRTKDQQILLCVPQPSPLGFIVANKLATQDRARGHDVQIRASLAEAEGQRPAGESPTLGEGTLPVQKRFPFVDPGPVRRLAPGGLQVFDLSGHAGASRTRTRTRT